MLLNYDSVQPQKAFAKRIRYTDVNSVNRQEQRIGMKSKGNESNRVSVGIIGAGIGGLSAAADLAAAGYKVTVLEKAATIGGSAGWYVRHGRRFPTGATLAFGLEAGGLMRSRLAKLGIDIAADMLEQPMDVILHDRTVSIFRESALWYRELAAKFHERSDRVAAFWSKLESIGEAVLGVSKSGVSLPVRHYRDLGSLPGLLLKKPGWAVLLAWYSWRTVGDLVKQYGLDDYEPLKQFLNLQLIDAAQTSLDRAALLPSSVALTVYREGSFALERGIGQISEALAEFILQRGGRIELLHPVRQLAYEAESNSWVAEGKKDSWRFDVIINNTGTELGLPTLEERSGDGNYWGAFRLDLIVKEEALRPFLAQHKLPFACQMAVPEELARRFGDEHGPIYVTFHHSLDGSGRNVDGEIMVTASVHTDPKRWVSSSKEEYAEMKARAAEDVLAYIERTLVISLKPHLITMEAGTPRTYRRYVGKAEVGGPALTVREAILAPKGPATAYPGLYKAGELVFPGPGTLSSFLSGWYAARRIRRKHPVRR